MSTTQTPITVTNNLPLDAATVSSPSLKFELNQSVATKNFTNVAINPINPSSSTITFNQFTGSISYNPFPYSIGSSSTQSLLEISNRVGNKINLLGYDKIDLDVGGAISTLTEGTDYTISTAITTNSTNSTILNVLGNLPFNAFEFESIQVGNYVYLVGGLNDISVSDTTVTKSYSSTCYYAYVNDNGILSEFQETSPLPAELTRGYLTEVAGTLVYMGGENANGVVDTIYTTTINSDGTLAAWSTSSTTLPIAGSYITAITVNDIIYLLNLYPGAKSSTSTPLTSMNYYTTTVTSGTVNAWTNGGSSLFGDAFYYGGQTLLLGSTIYILGGMDYDGGYHSGVWSTTISQTNTLSAAVDTNNNLPADLYDFNILNINNNLYLFGAYNNSGSGGFSYIPYGSTSAVNVNLSPANYSMPAIYTAPTASDTIGPWSILDSFPINACRGGVFYNDNKIYFIGGINIIANQNPTSTGNDTGYVYTPNTNTYLAEVLLGNIGSFVQQPLQLPTNNAQYGTIIIGDRIYAIGGYNNGIANTGIYYAYINEDDTISNWYTSNNVLPASIWGFAVIQIQNYIYLIGGFNGSSPVNTIYQASINSDNSLTPFILVGTLPTPITNGTVYIGNNTIYLIGGLNTTTESNSIYSAPINSSGAIGSWITSTLALPLGLRNACSFVADGNLFVFGNSQTVPANNIGYTISLNSNGSLNAVNTTSFNLPTTSTQYMTVNYINGTVYLIGNNVTSGSDTTFNIYTTTVTSGALGTWVANPTNLPVGTISQSVFNINNMLYVIGVTDNTNYYTSVYSFLLNFNYSYTISLTNALASVPTNLYLTQFVYGSGIIASGGYLINLTVNTQTYSPPSGSISGMYTYNYDTIYNTNNGNTVYFQFNNMNKGDLINAFRGVITGTELVPESSLTT